MFDFHRFHRNEQLTKIISETEQESSFFLDDDMLGMISAAGDMTPPSPKIKEE